MTIQPDSWPQCGRETVCGPLPLCRPHRRGHRGPQDPVGSQGERPRPWGKRASSGATWSRRGSKDGPGRNRAVRGTTGGCGHRSGRRPERTTLGHAVCIMTAPCATRVACIAPAPGLRPWHPEPGVLVARGAAPCHVTPYRAPPSTLNDPIDLVNRQRLRDQARIPGLRLPSAGPAGRSRMSPGRRRSPSPTTCRRHGRLPRGGRGHRWLASGAACAVGRTRVDRDSPSTSTRPPARHVGNLLRRGRTVVGSRLPPSSLNLPKPLCKPSLSQPARTPWAPDGPLRLSGLPKPVAQSMTPEAGREPFLHQVTSPGQGPAGRRMLPL